MDLMPDLVFNSCVIKDKWIELSNPVFSSRECKEPVILDKVRDSPKGDIPAKMPPLNVKLETL